MTEVPVIYKPSIDLLYKSFSSTLSNVSGFDVKKLNLMFLIGSFSWSCKVAENGQPKRKTIEKL